MVNGESFIVAIQSDDLDRSREARDIDAMPIKLYYRDYSNNQDKEIESSYRTTDKTTLNYLRNHDHNIPYSINTVHLQYPYKPPQRLEGFATKENFKVRPASVKVIPSVIRSLLAQRDPPAYNFLNNTELLVTLLPHQSWAFIK